MAVTPGRLAGLAAVLAVAAVLATVDSLRRWPDGAEHDAYARNLRQLQSLHHRLNDLVLRSSAGLTGSYDGLVATVDDIAAANARAAAPPAFLREPARGEILEFLASARASTERQAALVERFKTGNAVLRNSVRYFPTVAAESEREIEAGSAELAPEVRGLRFDVLRAVANPWQEGTLDRITARAEMLRASPAAGPAVLLTVRHASVVAERTREVGRYTRELLGLPARQHVAAMEARYTDAFGRALARGDLDKLVVALLVLASFSAAAVAVILRVKQARDDLEVTRAKLEEALALKNRFVSMTSHEFRTPLSVILSSAEMLETYAERWEHARRGEHLRRIQKHARALTELLDGLLLIGRTDAGHREFRPGPVDLDAVVAEVVEGQRPRAAGRVELEVKASGVGHPLMLDARLLRHILDNLVSNGIKYTREGGKVSVGVAWERGRAEIVVEDSGLGIPRADLERLFQSFHRGGNVQGIPGTGLGLTIVKRAVTEHGGGISVESEAGKGTRFRVTLPAEEAA